MSIALSEAVTAAIENGKKKWDPQKKALVVAELRSEKHKQGKHCLMKEVNGQREFCCLGLATEIYLNSEQNVKRINWEFVEGGGAQAFKGEYALLHPDVQEWLGAGTEQGGLVKITEEIATKYCISPGWESRYFSLPELNDACVPFHILADLIEEQL